LMKCCFSLCFLLCALDSWCAAAFELTNHVVLIVGWGVTDDANKTPYWIVKNSWYGDDARRLGCWRVHPIHRACQHADVCLFLESCCVSAALPVLPACRNERWGEKGYFRILRSSDESAGGECAIQSLVRRQLTHTRPLWRPSRSGGGVGISTGL